jgi:hypothetical protein
MSSAGRVQPIALSVVDVLCGGVPALRSPDATTDRPERSSLQAQRCSPPGSLRAWSMLVLMILSSSRRGGIRDLWPLVLRHAKKVSLRPSGWR